MNKARLKQIVQTNPDKTGECSGQSDQGIHYSRPLVCIKKIIFLFLNQNICCLNETVLLSIQNICENGWVRKYLQFYAQKFCFI